VAAVQILAAASGLLVALAWTSPGESSTHTVPPGRLASARQLLQEVERRAASVPASHDRTAFRLAIATVRARLGDVDAGLRELAAVPCPYDFSMREAVQAIARARAGSSVF
jgi:hypothetical protein